MSPDYALLGRLLRVVADRVGAAWPTPVWVDEGLGKAEAWANEEER